MLPSRIQRYFKAIDFDSSKSSKTLNEIESIMIKHGQTFAATTLPANLQDTVTLDFSNLSDYLLTNGYGFCFHHNIVAFEAFKYLGFDVALLLAQMRSEPDNKLLEIATHVCILLNLQDKQYLLDPSWGAAVLKPLPFDEKDTGKPGYRVAKLVDNRYGLVERRQKDKVRYEFNCTSVKINEFEFALKHAMSNKHDLYSMFFYQQKLNDGSIHYIFNRQYTCITSEGKKENIAFTCPATNILQSKFKLEPYQIERLTKGSYSNPVIRKIIVEFSLAQSVSSKNLHKNIYSFLTTLKNIQLVSKKWKENCDAYQSNPAALTIP